MSEIAELKQLLNDSIIETRENFKRTDHTLDLLAGHMIKQQNSIDGLVKGQEQLNVRVDGLSKTVDGLAKEMIEVKKSVLKNGIEMEALRHDIRDVLGTHVQNDTRIITLETTVEAHTEDIAVLNLVARTQGKN